MNRTARQKPIPLAILAVIILSACLSFARPQSDLRTGAQQVSLPVIATAVPSGDSYRFQFNEEAVARQFPQYKTQETSRLGRPIKVEDFKTFVQQEALKKMTEMFPQGITAKQKAKVKIEVTIKLTKPPEIGISISW